MRQKSVRWRRFSNTSYGVFCSLHKEVSVGVLSLAMLASFDAKAQTNEGTALEKAKATDEAEADVKDSVEIESLLSPLEKAVGARTTTTTVYGQLTDGQIRCVHYHSVLDVVANKCAICGKFYACYKCHDAREDHRYGAIPGDEPESVMCGVCGSKFSYNEYAAMGAKCKVCKAKFNPRCSLHKSIYCNTPGKENPSNKNQREKD